MVLRLHDSRLRPVLQEINVKKSQNRHSLKSHIGIYKSAIMQMYTCVVSGTQVVLL